MLCVRVREFEGQFFRRGDSHQLAVMAYATPLCSALLLASLGAALLTWNLLAGAVVIVIAGFLSRTDPQTTLTI